MHAEIEEGFARLAEERKKITQRLNEIGDIGTTRLKCWPLFNTSCVIAEAYQSDVRKHLKLKIAVDYLNDAKNEMKEYNIPQDDFYKLEIALKDVINAIDTSVKKEPTINLTR